MSLPRLRLSELGSDPVSVLRLVNHFDRIDETADDPVELVRASAVVAECPVEARWGAGTVIRYDAGGHQMPTVESDPASSPAARVRLERPGPPNPLDAIIVDRLRRLLDRRVATPHLGDPALVEIVISSTQDRADRARAIRLLGLDETRDIRVLAVSSDSPDALRMVTEVLAGERIRIAHLGGTVAVLYQGSAAARPLSDALEAQISAAYPTPLATDAGPGPWIGIGSGTGIFSAPKSWQEALRALRFASSTGYGRRAIAYERLSVLELLAELPLDRVLQNRDVVRINEIAGAASGALEVSTAEAFCVFGSLRRTAEELHVHHSTVANRLAHLAERMGWDFDDPMDRFMATLVLMVRRISLSARTLEEHDAP